jgi:hypothetical protein
MTANTETPISYGTISNTCQCEEDCYGICWEDDLYFFGLCTDELIANASGWWSIENVRLWHGHVSGYGQANNARDLLDLMTVRSEWQMEYRVFPDRIEYSLSHHDAPTGSASTIRPMPEDWEPF